MQSATTHLPDAAALRAFRQRIDGLNLNPLWERTTPQRPGGPCVPAIWHYDRTVRPYLLEATALITKRAADRRVLVLENPALRGTTYATTTLFAGLQIIMPGEIAAAHRHTQNALRLFVEGEGAYTTVAGERTQMRPGDFVVTPGWEWHDHGNLGAGPCVWLDGLDTPFAQFFGAIFREDANEEEQTVARPAGASAARFGATLLPIDYVPRGTASPMLIYPYEKTRAALQQLAACAPPHAAHGVKLRYANPANGRHPFPTMAVYMQLLPAGFAGTRYRATDGTVFAVIEGRGSIELGEERFAFGPRDIFVVPSWSAYRLKAESACVLFSYSDRAAQETLGFFREEIL